MKEDYQPFVLGTGFSIRPPDIAPPQGDYINIIMARGAFGSGEHETTRSCLELIEKFEFTGSEKVLDLGSGTGILSIATLLLGAGHAWCVDIEPDAVQSCQKNCRLNGVNDRVTHVCGPLESLNETGFDIILANIYGDILLDIADEVVAKAKSGAKILLSGMLWEYNFDVRQKYKIFGCEEIKNRLLEDFSTTLLVKR